MLPPIRRGELRAHVHRLPGAEQRAPVDAAVAIAAGAAALVAAAPAGASILVATGARSPALKVDAKGFAEVGWTDSGGVRRTLLIPPRGRVLPGGRLPGRNVARRDGARLAMAKVVLRTPDGRLWALQSWRRAERTELRFSRWSGSPTSVTLATICCRLDSETLEGRAVFSGKPVFGRSPTTAGRLVRIVAYLDRATTSGWAQMRGVFPRAPDGIFRLWVRPEWQAPRYRVTIAGPNLAWAMAPDARAVAASSLP